MPIKTVNTYLHGQILQIQCDNVVRNNYVGFICHVYAYTDITGDSLQNANRLMDRSSTGNDK